MAVDKITLVDLRKALAQQEQIDESTAGTFLSELLAAIVEGLKQDKQVRINGLGTFKLQWVEPRKSVNISTGEPIIIDGYQKLSFTPEQSLKERVNEPFADYAAVELNDAGETIQTIRKPKADPLQKMDEQAEEIKDLLADLGTPIADTPTPETPEQPEAPETPEEPTPIETIKTTIETTIETIEPTPATPTPEPAPEPTAKPAPKPFRPWLVAVITMAVLAILLVVAFFFLQHKIEQWADMLNGKIEHPAQVAEPTSVTPADPKSQQAEPQQEQAEPLPADTIAFDEPATPAAPTPEKPISPEKPGYPEKPGKPVTPAAPNFLREHTFTDFIGTETVAEGSRLTWIAKKYYGKKDLWVFIYEANRDRIKNPANVVVGSELRIPTLPDSIVAMQAPVIINYIKQLQDTYLSK